MLKIVGNIETIRAVEDTIRYTNHYEENLLSPNFPIQGSEIPTRVYTKVLVVPVNTMKRKVSGVLKEFMRAEVLDAKKIITDRTIKIKFWYDNRNDEANIQVDPDEVTILCDIVKGFKEAIANVKTDKIPTDSVQSVSQERHSQ